MTVDVAQIAALTPLLLISGTGCLALLLATFNKGHELALRLAQLGCLAALAAVAGQWTGAESGQSIWAGMWAADRMALFLDAVLIATALVTLLVAAPFMREHDFEHGEHHALVLFATAGMMTVVHATHLLSLLIGIETMSLAAYLLVASWRRQPAGAEGALKYLLLGAFAAGFLVYGTALVYGTTGGEMSYSGIAARAHLAAGNPLFIIGVYFLLTGLLFKIAAVPFHMWAPDAYEAAPTPVTGLMAAGIKVAAVGGLVRLLGAVFADPGMALGHAGWVRVLGGVAFVTMTWGNLAALRQENIKRMLAYSSVAHAGYLLIGLAALGQKVDGAQPALLVYLAAYGFTTLGVFAVVAWVGRRDDERVLVREWAGLARTRPAVALAMTVLLLSLAGVPPTGGFFGKFYVFRAAMQSPDLAWLVVAAVLNSLVSVYYYLRIVVAMYFRDPVRPWQPFPSAGMALALVVIVVVVLALGLVPGPVIDLAAGGLGAHGP
jgi:NADH-quinone oxidoreductase subunit N